MANFSLLGGCVRGEGHEICTSGFTSSPGSIYPADGGTPMWMVDPKRQLTFVFLSCSFVDCSTHFARLLRLSDLALAACCYRLGAFLRGNATRPIVKLILHATVGR